MCGWKIESKFFNLILNAPLQRKVRKTATSLIINVFFVDTFSVIYNWIYKQLFFIFLLLQYLNLFLSTVCVFVSTYTCIVYYFFFHFYYNFVICFAACNKNVKLIFPFLFPIIKNRFSPFMMLSDFVLYGHRNTWDDFLWNFTTCQRIMKNDASELIDWCVK